MRKWQTGFQVAATLGLVLATVKSKHPLDAAGISLLTFAAIVATPELLDPTTPARPSSAPEQRTTPEPSGGVARWVTWPLAYLAPKPPLVVTTLLVGALLTVAGIINAAATINVFRSGLLLGLGISVMLLAWFAMVVSWAVERTASEKPINKQAVEMWFDERRERLVLLVVSATFLAGTVVQLGATFAS